jgi:hypothetical protein
LLAKRCTCAAVAAVALLAGCGGKPGQKLLVGVDDDSVKWTASPARLLRVTAQLGLDAVRVTLPWEAGRRRPARLERTYLRRIERLGRRRRVVLAVYGAADAAPRTRGERDAFCGYVRAALRLAPSVRDVVIWNEANSRTYWRPRHGAAGAYTALLARCYDVLHDARSDVNVLDSTAAGHEAAAFLRAVGAAYRSSVRSRPLVDTFGHNPYPVLATEPPWARHAGGWIGQGDYPALVRALRDAFGGTAQRTPDDGAKIWYLEDGFQTTVPHRIRAYTGRENVGALLPAAEQARSLAAALRLAYCQPAVGAFFNFELADETRLVGWQSGLLFANWRRKPAFEPFRAAVADVRHGRVSCRR